VCFAFSITTGQLLFSCLLLLAGTEKKGLNTTKVCPKELCFLYESANKRRDALIKANAWPEDGEYDDPFTLALLRFLYHELKYDVEPLDPTEDCTCCTDPSVAKKILARAFAGCLAVSLA
jgi:hypothetical protein